MVTFTVMPMHRLSSCHLSMYALRGLYLLYFPNSLYSFCFQNLFMFFNSFPNSFLKKKLKISKLQTKASLFNLRTFIVPITIVLHLAELDNLDTSRLARQNGIERLR